MRTAAGPAPGVTAGVGRTALLVAAARAVETHRPDALARDPFAAAFVRAALDATDWPLHPDEVPGGASDPLWGRLGRYFGLRTRVLDDHLLASARSGVRQVVLLGAGLDSRAFRLDWPAGTLVHEIDSADVLGFKQSVLDGIGAEPVAERRPCVADLRDDWTEALLSSGGGGGGVSGFDPSVPTAWLAEGLLLYLPAEAERRLMDDVDRLSAAGSTLAYEIKEVTAESGRVRSGPVYTTTRERIGIDLPGLFAAGPRPDSAGSLAARGWQVAVHRPYDFTALHGRGPLPEPDDALEANRWIFATADRPAPGRGRSSRG
ncbi:SAM-dependent methyltransferase [Streptomyces sp. NPDC098101]|uniref:SAM-dependent methyltransferase n=1 Tax=Streptomyces sp. NPDC098101 TaxID=3366096 RepID=UPI0038076186